MLIINFRHASGTLPNLGSISLDIWRSSLRRQDSSHRDNHIRLYSNDCGFFIWKVELRIIIKYWQMKLLLQVPRHLSASLSSLPLLYRKGQANHPSHLACKLHLCHALGNVHQGNPIVALILIKWTFIVYCFPQINPWLFIIRVAR